MLASVGAAWASVSCILDVVRASGVFVWNIHMTNLRFKAIADPQKGRRSLPSAPAGRVTHILCTHHKPLHAPLYARTHKHTHTHRHTHTHPHTHTHHTSLRLHIGECCASRCRQNYSAARCCMLLHAAVRCCALLTQRIRRRFCRHLYYIPPYTTHTQY